MDRINNNEKFSLYYNFLVQENEKYNLTNITEKEEAYIKHFYDSVQLEKVIDLNNITSLCDVGSGAGRNHRNRRRRADSVCGARKGEGAEL